MARVNTEDCWWTDPRRTALGRLGVDADGCALRAWKLAQDYWKNDRQLVPRALFETLDGASELIQVGLAEVRGEHVYVRGSSDYLGWIAERREAGRTGGRVSALRPRDEAGRLLPNNTGAESKQTPCNRQANTNQTQASVSFSGSKKNSNTARTGVRAEYTAAFEGAWEAYGKEGKKADASKAFQELNLTPEESQDLLKAIAAYLADCARADRRRMYFGTFLREDWRVWLERRGPPGQKLKTLDEIEQGGLFGA